MLTALDELAVHQTPAVLAQVATSDPHAYERFYFQCFELGGAASLGLTVTVHPNKGLIDGGLVATRGGRHETLLFADRLGAERRELAAGPVRLSFDDPMARLTITVDHPDFAARLEYLAATPALEEERVTRLRAGRVVQDRSRYAQLGSVAGSIRSPLGEFEATHDTWFAGRDHSWGVQNGPRPHASDEPAAGGSFFWLIGALADEGLVVVEHADAEGRPYGRYAAACPSLSAGADPAGPGSGQRSREVHDISLTYPPTSRHFSSAELTVGAERLTLESLCAVLPRSIGYGHPEVASGAVHPDLPFTHRDSWNLADEDLLAPRNHRGLQFVRITHEDGRVGHGVVDQLNPPTIRKQ